MKFNFGLFLLSTPTLLLGTQGKDTELFGDGAPGIPKKRKLQTNGYNEWLGECNGAVCGLWGDPHIVTCDNVRYDCQALGLMQLMDNHAVSIQGNFVDVGKVEHDMVRGWGLTHGASITNDVAIHFKTSNSGDEIPVVQVGMAVLGGDGRGNTELQPGEEDCDPLHYYNPTDGVPGHWRSVEPTLAACRARCESVEGCECFSWWYDGGCHLNKEANAIRESPHNWSRAVRGTLNSDCGVTGEENNSISISDAEEQAKYGLIHGDSASAKCPYVMHIGREMIDLTGVGPGSYIVGDANSDFYVQQQDARHIKIKNTLPSGGEMVVYLIAKGQGPGQLWSCHWDQWMCLPNSDQGDFETDGKGLMGTPNGNWADDWMTVEGDMVPIEAPNNDWHKAVYEYCQEWCVEQEDSLMKEHNGETWEDIGCPHTPYTDITSDSCVLSEDKILTACADVPDHITNACHVDCCYNGCGAIPETVEEIEDIKPLGDDDGGGDIVIEPEVNAEEACDESAVLGTGSADVCPGSDIVSLLNTNGNTALPPRAIFYGITVDTGDEDIGATVKFKVANPFDESAYVYVKHEKRSPESEGFPDEHCVGLPDVGVCSGEEIEVACHEYGDNDPFALVELFFVSPGVAASDTEVDKCCQPETGLEGGVVGYTFEIKCTCPTASTA